MARGKPITAADSQRLLDEDPAYQKMMAEKERAWRERRSILMRDQQPLLDELVSIGWPNGVRQIGETRSVWDLVNTPVSYPEFISVLAKHLQLPHQNDTRQAIARALSVKEASGKPAARVVLEELKKMREPRDAGENAVRFALANALVTIGDASMQSEVVQMMKDPKYKEIHVDLKRVFNAILKRPSSSLT